MSGLHPLSSYVESEKVIGVNTLMTVASRTRARWFIRCGIVRKIGCGPLVARKMYVGQF